MGQMLTTMEDKARNQITSSFETTIRTDKV